jgi:hypothetical protein
MKVAASLLALGLLLAACNSDSGSSADAVGGSPDAVAGAQDATAPRDGGSGADVGGGEMDVGGAGIDAGGGGVMDAAPGGNLMFGDPCMSSNDMCDRSMMLECHLFGTSDLCSKMCAMDGDCPSGSQGQKCNIQHFCRP